MHSRQMMQYQYRVGTTQPAGRALGRGRRVTINQWEQGLLFRHGRLVSVVGAGPQRLWGGGFMVRVVDMRPWVVLVPAQEVPTADGATVKVTVAGQVRVTDPTSYVIAARDAEQALYLAVQVSLRELLATTTVDDLLAGRADMSARLVGGLRGLDALGIAVDQLELKDIILPGELKRAHTEVLVARAQGTAALERARGETAALRALANAARLAGDNPALLQLRLLQHLDSSTGNTVVIGIPAFSTDVVTAAAAPRTTGRASAKGATRPGE